MDLDELEEYRQAVDEDLARQTRALLPAAICGLCLYIVAIFATVEAIRFLISGSLP